MRQTGRGSAGGCCRPLHSTCSEAEHLTFEYEAEHLTFECEAEHLTFEYEAEHLTFECEAEHLTFVCEAEHLTFEGIEYYCYCSHVWTGV